MSIYIITTDPRLSANSSSLQLSNEEPLAKDANSQESMPQLVIPEMEHVQLRQVYPTFRNPWAPVTQIVRYRGV